MAEPMKKPGLALIFKGGGGDKAPPPGEDEDDTGGPTEQYKQAFREYSQIEDDPDADEDAKAEAFWRAVKACVGSY